MNVIIKPRGYGKTYDLIRLSSETRIPIVCMNPNFVEQDAKEYGYDIPRPLSPKEWISTNAKEVYVDDIDCVLKKLFDAEPVCVTMSLPD